VLDADHVAIGAAGIASSEDDPTFCTVAALNDRSRAVAWRQYRCDRAGRPPAAKSGRGW